MIQLTESEYAELIRIKNDYKVLVDRINNKINYYKKQHAVVKNEKWADKKDKQKFLNEIAIRYFKLEELLG
jgi:hypothetical protein